MAQNEKEFLAFDLQKNEELSFSSVEELKSWRTEKIVWMCISLVLGLALTIALLGGMGAGAIVFFFLPYMIRQVRHSLGDMFDSGAFGEFFSIALVLLGTITVIYPAYKLYREITEYSNLKNKYSL